MLNSYDMPIAGYSNSDKTAFKYFKGGDKFHYVSHRDIRNGSLKLG